MHLWSSVIALVLMAAELAGGAEVTQIKFPEKNWALELAVTAAEVSLNQNIENRRRYVTGTSAAGAPWSVQLERTPLTPKKDQCAGVQLMGLLHNGSITDRQSVVMRDEGDIIALSFAMALPDGTKRVRKYGIVARDEVCAWVHVSSSNPSEQTERSMDALIASLRIVPAEPDPNAAQPPLLALRKPPAATDPKYSNGIITSSIAGKPWLIEIPIADYKPVFSRDRSPTERYFGGKIEANNLDFSVMLYPYGEGQSALNCRDYHLLNMRQRGMLGDDMIEQRVYENDGVPMLDYSSKFALGKPDNRYHLHAWYFQDGFCSVLHFSKDNITQIDKDRIAAITSSVSFKANQP